jgi:hypothetical protein
LGLSRKSPVRLGRPTFTLTLTAYNVDHPAGVSSNVVVTVEPFLSPSLQSAGVVSNAFQFNFLAQGRGLYLVQYATNLTPPALWQTLPLSVFGSTHAVMTVTDTAITNSPRFYRVRGQ